ncbi:MAG: hypothetical protein WAV32_07685 [Halobacteriota archaeon]
MGWRYDRIVTTRHLPTNCCAAWFCPGSSHYGKVNIAVFFYGCNFNCIFCLNASHKEFGIVVCYCKKFIFYSFFELSHALEISEPVHSPFYPTKAFYEQ